MKAKNKKGFTLIEIMVVVLLIATLTAIAVPAFLKVKRSAENTAVIGDLRLFSHAFETYAFEEGTWPGEAAPGEVPIGMEARLNINTWTRISPIGGNYDWDFDTGSFMAGLGVKAHRAIDEQLLAMDRRLDDGDLGSGRIRLSGGDFMFILEEATP